MFYLSWLPVAMRQFARVSSDFWLGPVTFRTICGYVDIVFSTAGAVTTWIFFISFCFILVLFARRKEKNFKDYFLFSALCCLIGLALFGTIISIVIRPIFSSRYLVPACSFVWLFYAAESSLIKAGRIRLLQFSSLCTLGILTFFSLTASEKQQNENFDKFYTYAVEHIMQDDVIVFEDVEKSAHMAGIMAYLFPGHIQAFIEQPNNGAYSDAFDRTITFYSALNNIDNKRKWVILENEQDESQNNHVPGFEPDKIFCGDYGWSGYKFKLYCLD